jgi:hypothetical protein
MFVGLCKDRAAGLSVAPAVTLQRYVHTLALLLLVLAADGVGWLLLLWQYQQRTMSWRMCLLFGLDLAVTAVDAAKATLRYVARKLTRTMYATMPAIHWPPRRYRHCVCYLMILQADVVFERHACCCAAG